MFLVNKINLLVLFCAHVSLAHFSECGVFLCRCVLIYAVWFFYLILMCIRAIKGKLKILDLSRYCSDSCANILFCFLVAK